MRIIEINVLFYNDEKQDWEFDAKTVDENARCFIDLDCVTSVWENPHSKEICIRLADGYSYMTNSYSIDEFFLEWSAKL
jgi:hypothetical protein